MKILIPILEFGKAGGYRVLSNLANEWIALGHQVDFICPIASLKPYFPTVAGIYWVDNKGVFHTDSDLIDVRRYKIWNRWAGLAKGMKNLKENYDIILANHSLTAYPVYFTKITGKKFYYIQAYEPEYGKLSPHLHHKLLAVLAWQSYNLKLNRIVNAGIYKNYENIITRQVVLPGLDLDNFNDKGSFSFKKERAVKIGCIGRLEKYKGTLYVMEAFKKLKTILPHIELHIAFGDVSIRDEGVEIITPKNDKELANFYKSMDIVIAPGTIQLGAVHYPVIESMASGTPIITTGYYPADETNSWIVPIENGQAIADKVLDILDNADLANEKSRKAIHDIQEFEWKTVALRMLNYFSGDSNVVL